MNLYFTNVSKCFVKTKFAGEADELIFYSCKYFVKTKFSGEADELVFY